MIENGMRRVTTGETPEGKSVVVKEEQIAPQRVTGLDLYRVWSTAAAPIHLPTQGDYPVVDANKADLVHISVAVIPPHTLVGAGAAAHINFDDDGFHKTASVDVVFVVDGEVVMGVPGAPLLILNKGDCIVQNGALHSWENKTNRPATILFTVVKGQR